ncbi:MAG: hypothetical protein QMB59_00650 [Bacteroidales bacterium]|jgi:hypothetical protein
MSAIYDFFVGSKIYGLPHILLLVYWAIKTALIIWLTLAFAKSDKAKEKVIKIFAIIILVETIASRFIYAGSEISLLRFIPGTFCSTMGFVLPLFVLFSKKDSKGLFFALFSGFMGGMITIFSGDNVGQAAVQNTFISFAYHGNMAALALLCYALRYSTFTIDKIPALYVGLCIMVVWGKFTNDAFGFANNMFLNAPLIPGTFITWWFTGICIVLIATIVSLIYQRLTQ